MTPLGFATDESVDETVERCALQSDLPDRRFQRRSYTQMSQHRIDRDDAQSHHLLYSDTSFPILQPSDVMANVAAAVPASCYKIAAASAHPDYVSGFGR